MSRRPVVACWLLAAAAAAADAPAPVPAPSSATQPAVAPAPAANGPFLGLTVEPGGDFDGVPGLPVSAVVPGSTVAKAGLRVGDRLLRLDATEVKAIEDVGTAARALVVGAPITLSVRRGDQTLTLAGTVERAPRPRELSQQTEELAREVAELKRLLQDRPPAMTLEQLARLLQQVEADLPKAAAEFKARYPDGEFSVSIHIDIRSDRKAADPRPIGPAPSATGPAATPAP